MTEIIGHFSFYETNIRPMTAKVILHSVAHFLEDMEKYGFMYLHDKL
jgi:hypothetical protein